MMKVGKVDHTVSVEGIHPCDDPAQHDCTSSDGVLDLPGGIWWMFLQAAGSIKNRAWVVLVVDLGE